MKSTGIIRKIDELGRIVVPMNIRNKLDLKEKDSVEIYLSGSSIILKKFEPSCIFCNSTKDLKLYKDKLICAKCANKIGSLKKD